jgi:sortase A
MALYYYLKAPSFSNSQNRSGKLFSGLSIGLGILIIGIVFGSMGVYQWRAQRNFQNKTGSFSAPDSVLGSSEENSGAVDYTKLSSWFSAPPSLSQKESRITHYNLSIPVLGIYQAVVEIGGEDLGKSMIHYPTTSLPGEKGNGVVFCHSVLPQFFNPKNYKTICSTLPTIRIGDRLTAYFDGIEYIYQVIEMKEVEPDDHSVLDQDSEGEYLSLITCVPPGTYLRRLVVKTRLI